MSEQTMTKNMEVGATVVITHHVPLSQQVLYEAWLDEIGPVCKASEGLLDWHIIRPIKHLTESYTVIIRYDNEQHLKQWMESHERAQLLAKVERVLANKEDVHINSSLDFLFSPPASKPVTPVRWKQFLITWSAIFPLVLSVPLMLLPVLSWLKLSNDHALTTLIITGVVVYLMVYVVMPRYTRLVRSWLFK